MPERTEKEKMLAGEKYNCLDPVLEVERQKAKELIRQYNLTQTEPERLPILQQMLGGIGQNPIIWPPFYCSYGKNTYLGDQVFINYMCTILDNNEVRIGSQVMIGPAVQIYTAAHDLQAEARNQGWEVSKPLLRAGHLWFGLGAVLLPGGRIGRNAVVGAGAVVSQNVAMNTIVAGNPARVIRKIEL